MYIEKFFKDSNEKNFSKYILKFEFYRKQNISIDKFNLIKRTFKAGPTALNLAQNPNVFAVYDITRMYDALILARFKTRAGLSKMIKEEINASFNVEHTNTHIILNIVKEGCSFTELIEKEIKKVLS